VTLDAARLGTDLDIPTDPGGSIRVTPTGDIPLLVGRPALDRGIERRLLTEPGAMVYRPTFGAGLLGRVGAANSPVERGRLAYAARLNLLADPRIKDAAVTATPSTDDPGRVDIAATVTLRDDSKSVLTVTA